MTNAIRTFITWIVTRGGKPEELLFKTEREAELFVKNVYRKNGGPNEKLRELYGEYKSLKDVHPAA